MSTYQLVPLLSLAMMGKLRLRPAVLLVLLVLAGCARGKAGRDAYPSIATICRTTRLDRKTVRAALLTLRTLPRSPLKMQARATNKFPTRWCFDMALLTAWVAEAKAEAAQRKLQIAIAEEDAGHKVGRRLQPVNELLAF